jgi:hypothetical protein
MQLTLLSGVVRNRKVNIQQLQQQHESTENIFSVLDGWCRESSQFFICGWNRSVSFFSLYFVFL